MNFMKYSVLDFVFVVFIAGVLIQLILKSRNREGVANDNIFNNKSQEEIPINIPNLNDLLDLEKKAAAKGSGIVFESLIGLWKFSTVWKKGIDKEDSITSLLLRLFQANLELIKSKCIEDESEFQLINSIQYGFLSIRFIGFGELKGNQPLLIFYFDRIELKVGDNILLNRSIDLPDPKNKPFFALIAMGEKGRWLSARGRGGGLAVWQRN